MQPEVIVADRLRAEVEDRGEMPDLDLAAEFQIAAIDAELREQRTQVDLAFPQPCDGLPRPIGIELHIRSLTGGKWIYFRVPAWPQMSLIWSWQPVRNRAFGTTCR